MAFLRLATTRSLRVRHHLSREYDFSREKWTQVINDEDREWLLSSSGIDFEESKELGDYYYRCIASKPCRARVWRTEIGKMCPVVFEPGKAYKVDAVTGRSLNRNDRFARVSAEELLRARPRERLLICRGRGLGDLLLLTPALRELKRRAPDCTLTMVVDRVFLRVLSTNPVVAGVMDFARAYETAPHGAIYDLNYYVERSPEYGAVNRSQIFAHGLGLPDLEDLSTDYAVLPEERAQASALGLNEVGRPLVGIQFHGSNPRRGPSREWMSRLVAGVVARGWLPVVLGTERGNPLEGALDLRGSTGLGALGAVLERCDAVVGLDSGITHLANALRRPTLALYGPIRADLRVRGQANCVPLQGNDYAGCSPCNDAWRPGCEAYARCLEAIPIDLVLSKLGELLDVGRHQRQ